MPQWFTDLTSSQWWAASRHYITFAFGILGGVGVLTVVQQHDAMAAVDHIASGLTELATGIGTLITIAVPIINGWKAAHKASPTETIKTVAAIAADPVAPMTTEAKVVLLNAAAEVPGTQKVVNPVLSSDPATNSKVTPT